MRWHRVMPGVYTAGPYTVERFEHAGGFWQASGPGLAAVSHQTKDDAQSDATDAALLRVAGQEATVVPVRGDVAEVPGRGRGVVTTRLAVDNGGELWCLRLARGRRLCLRREEFQVVLP